MRDEAHSVRPRRAVGWRRRRRLPGTVRAAGAIGLAAVLLPVTVTAASAEPDDPARVGRFTAPFEERGPEARCERQDDGRIACTKPVGVSAVALNDGRVLYWDGIDGAENVKFVFLGELDNVVNGRGRVMSLGEDGARWTVPSPEDAGGENIDTRDDPLGTVGAPGRPGDGLTGSTLGEVAEANPQAPPEDPARNDADLFCSYQLVTEDGRVVVFGGTDWYNEPRLNEHFGVGELAGIRNTAVFDPAKDEWTQSTPMNHARFYPSGVTMADGSIMAISGAQKVFKPTQLTQVRRTETLDPDTMEWTENYTGPASENSLPLFPSTHLMPDGTILYYGSGETWAPMGQAVDEALWAVMQKFDPETKEWSAVGVNPIGSRNVAMDVMLPLEAPYDEATVLSAGGTLGPFTSQVPVPVTQEVTVTKGGATHVERTGDTKNLRWGGQAVLLPDGTVFAVGGADMDHLTVPGLEHGVRQAEIYDPATQEWTAVASMDRDRIYHHSAVLLADGRVMVGGSSPAPTGYLHPRDLNSNNDRDPSFQIYSPPYLFRGERPTIEHVQRGLGYGQDFEVTVDGGEVESVMLVRTMATNHMVDNDQRALFLDFTQDGRTLTVAAPPDGLAAPPGTYHLFVNRRTVDGPVPSVARILSVGEKADPAPAQAPVVTDSEQAVAGIGATPDPDSTLRTPGDCPWCEQDPDHEPSDAVTGFLPGGPTSRAGRRHRGARPVRARRRH